MDNGRREYPQTGVEQDVVSSRGRYRRFYCYLANGNGVAKKVKTQMNRRFRRRAKIEIRNGQS